MASRFELGVVGASGSIGAAQWELRAGSADPIWVREVGIFLNAATASSFTLGKAANTPAGGSVALGVPVNQVTNPAGGITTTWSTAPTAPTAIVRRILLPAAIGNGIIWTFQGDGLLIPASGNLVLWNLAASSIASCYVVWEE